MTYYSKGLKNNEICNFFIDIHVYNGNMGTHQLKVLNFKCFFYIKIVI